MSRHNRRGVATRAVAKLVSNRAKPAKTDDRSWYRVGTVTNKTVDAPSSTEVWIYDEIGMWGISASDFAQDLAAIDTDSISVRLNSPGGEVYDGIAILNALIAHPAHVTVNVDGLAASVASVIAMAGDKVVMGSHSEMMIHDASTIAIGNAAEVREVADMLDRVSNNIAQVYSERAGGKPANWRSLMLDETWFSADEAVKAGLADEVAPAPKERTGEDAPDQSGAGGASDASRHARILARWDLDAFTYSGRAAAPDPAIDQIQSTEAQEAAQKAATQSTDAPEAPPTQSADPGNELPPVSTVTTEQPIPADVEPDFDLAEAFRLAMNPPAIDAEVFHAAVALVTNADVLPSPVPVRVQPVTDQAFPADLVPEPVLDGVSDLFRAAMQLAVYDAPDVVLKPEVPAPVVDDFAVIDPTEFYNSLREAIIK